MTKRLIALFIQTAMLAALLSAGSGIAFAHDPEDEDVVSQGCSELAHARNDAFRALHKSWKHWRGELRTLERDAKVALKAAEKAADKADRDTRGELRTLERDAKVALEAAKKAADKADSDKRGELRTLERDAKVALEAAKKAADKADKADKADSVKLELLVDTTRDSVKELLDAAADELSDLRHDAKHALNDLFDGSVCGDGDDDLDEDDVQAVTTNADAALPAAEDFMKIATDADKAMEAVIDGGASTGTAGTASTSKGVKAEVTAFLSDLKKELQAVTTDKATANKNKAKAQADDSDD